MIQERKKDFPFFEHNPQIIFLDNASTTHKPKIVLDTLQNFYTHHYSSIGRGAYALTEENQLRYQNAKNVIVKFLNAQNSDEIIITSSATHSLNIIANSLKHLFKPGDEIIISALEHNSNVLPWLKLTQEQSVRLIILPLKSDYTLENISHYLSPNTRLVSLTQVANNIGTAQNLSKLFKLVKQYNPKIFTIADSSQAVGHLRIDVQKLCCDFLAFSGHKIYGPNGVGVLYANHKIHHFMQPCDVGGGMVHSLDNLMNFTNQSIGFPKRFEAGTINAPNVIAMAKAIEYLDAKLDSLAVYYTYLNTYLRAALDNHCEVNFIGDGRGPIIALHLPKFNHYDLSLQLSRRNICIRIGHLCSHIATGQLKVSSLLRISLALYNDQQDLELFCTGLLEAIKRLS